jgi:hypothetical protein
MDEIPDPQTLETFTCSKLDWGELERLPVRIYCNGIAN